MVPPDTFPNSEVKRQYADDSVAFAHVKVGHRQHLIPKPRKGLFYCLIFVLKVQVLLLYVDLLYCMIFYMITKIIVYELGGSICYIKK